MDYFLRGACTTTDICNILYLVSFGNGVFLTYTTSMPTEVTAVFHGVHSSMILSEASKRECKPGGEWYQFLRFSETRVVYRHLHGKTGWSTVVVNGTRQILNGNFHGDALVPFPRLSRKIRSKVIQPKGRWLVKTNKWNVHFPFGNSVWKFWSTFQEILS